MRSSALPLLPLTTPRGASRFAWAASCILMVALVAAADYATGYEVSLFVLYLVPVFVATWTFGLSSGVMAGLLATLTWYAIFMTDHSHPHGFYHGWDAAVRASTMAVFAVLIHHLKLALARSDERFVTVLEGLDAAIYVADARTGDLLYVNERCRRAFGPPTPRHLSHIERRLTAEPGGSPGAPGVAAQREVRDRAASRAYLIDVRSTRWVDGRNVDLHVATDITQHIESERRAREQQQKLDMTSRLIAAGEMASTLAHELKHPLAAVLNYNTGCLALIESGACDGEELRDGIEKSSAEAERAGRIVQQVRDFIRTREPKRVSCDANAVIAEAARLVHGEAARSSTRILLDLAPECPPLHADPVMLQEVVLNLTRNAIEAMREVDVAEREIVLTSRTASDELHVSIADRGPGLPPPLIERLFIPFFTTKAGGMGLGLHICRSIVEFHEGRLWAAPRPHGGTVFHVSLPFRGA